MTNPEWRETRRALFKTLDEAPPDEASADRMKPKTARMPTPFRAPQRCLGCGYDIEGCVIDAIGRGTCSECGEPFLRKGR